MASQGGSSTAVAVATPAATLQSPPAAAPPAAPPPPPPMQRVALPLHVQKLQAALSLERFIDQVERAFDESLSIRRKLEDVEQADRPKRPPPRVYNFTHVTEERQWVKDLLLSPSEDSESELSETEQLQIMLELQHKRRKKWRKRLKKDHKLIRYKYFSAGLLSSKDRYPEHIKKLEEKGLGLRKVKDGGSAQVKENYRQRVWGFIVKKEIPKMAKQFSTSRHNTIITNKKVAQLCQREVKKQAVKSQRTSKDLSSVQPRARRLMKEALVYWRRYEKVEREQRKKAEKEAMEQRKRDDEMREAKRQQRKLNFLITQTELYAHFIGKKLTGEADQSEKILQKLEDTPLQREIQPGVVVNLENPEDYDSEAAKAKALANVRSAFQKQITTHHVYKDLAQQGVSGGQNSTMPPAAQTDGESDLQESFDKNFSLATPMLQSDREVPQPTMFSGELKAYQLKGMNWLANLYDQGINGILADEMGLGKTVQSVAFMAHLAEHQGIWGPFLIVSPASTLHNWQQECTRFVPRFKALPYWGSPQERKVIRKYWNQKLLYKENAPFHVLITSYQLVVQDVKYFQRVKWQYMILDEAQAIKSSTSLRWKVLLSFNCRNRLLLTGTPIQNTMQELWALLHFIMPTMFDSHEEFNEWFSRDIESHAEKKSVMDEHQLSRLHLILKPFMLRRIKRDVEHEMAEKIEVHLSCDLSTRQKKLYQALKQRISIDDLLQSSLAPASRDSATSHLLNLVMQFRKVCNHPDLFERRNVISPVSVSLPSYNVPSLIYHTPISPAPHYYRLTQLGVFSAHHIHESTFTPEPPFLSGCWGFLRLLDWSPQQASAFALGDLTLRMTLLVEFMKQVHLLYQQRQWNSKISPSRFSRTQLVLWPSFKLSAPAVASSPLLRPLVFSSHAHSGYAHITHRVYPLQTFAHTSAELIKISSTINEGEGGKGGKEAAKEEDEEEKEEKEERKAVAVPESDMAAAVPTSEYEHWTQVPGFLITYIPKVHAPWEPPYCSDRSAEHHRLLWAHHGGPALLKEVLLHGPPSAEEDLGSRNHIRDLLRAPTPAGLMALSPPRGWSNIQIPEKMSMIFDSGKMTVLDKLLVKLKQEQHRVLIYSQMTRMIDLLEEFMGFRRYRCIRLDGSSRISDRRDMVADFQSNADIFVFLLSTRAGGLGINLTAADTVIFYDSDWNPTVDQQAMDRAHRLGQTKQVTVYRLIVKGTIEEKILQRAREKSEIQKMVISGGDFKPETLKAKEMVSLLLDDEEMETRFLAKQAEKKAILEKIEQGKRNSRNNKKRAHPPGGSGDVEPLLKRPKSKGGGLVSATPSPSPMTLVSSRPGSVMSTASTATTATTMGEPPLNGNSEDLPMDPPGSNEGSETNLEIVTSTAGTTPVRKPAKSRLGVLLGASPGANGTKVKRTAAPLGGRGKMQKSTKKGGGRSAAASAGAIAGAKAATSAAYAAYGLPPHHIAPSPISGGAGSTTQVGVVSNLGLVSTGGGGGGSSHSHSSSPRVSPVPMAFVATSLVTTPPSNKTSTSKAPSSLTFARNNV